MGCRIHVVKRQRKYGETRALNYGMENFAHLLRTLGCDVCQGEEEYNFCETRVGEYKRAILVFEKYVKHIVEDNKNKGAFISSLDKLQSTKEVLELYDNEEFFNEMSIALEEFGVDDYPPQYLLDVLKNYLKERDKKSDWIQFEMF